MTWDKDKEITFSDIDLLNKKVKFELFRQTITDELYYNDTVYYPTIVREVIVIIVILRCPIFFSSCCGYQIDMKM